MFTGIIECIGKIVALEKQGSNFVISIRSTISSSLKIDQSIAHNGVCLTVVKIVDDVHTVVAIAETLVKSTIHLISIGDLINLEQAMLMNTRLDGHLVQGHVDTTAACIEVRDDDGSWVYTFEFDEKHQSLVVEKGSICIDGISLTLFNVTTKTFSVAIIPYTYEHTCIHLVKIGSLVNLEFDIIGKYVARHASVFN